MFLLKNKAIFLIRKFSQFPHELEIGFIPNYFFTAGWQYNSLIFPNYRSTLKKRKSQRLAVPRDVINTILDSLTSLLSQDVVGDLTQMLNELNKISKNKIAPLFLFLLFSFLWDCSDSLFFFWCNENGDFYPKKSNLFGRQKYNFCVCRVRKSLSA